MPPVDEVLLGREVVEDRLLGDVGGARDLGDGDALEAALGEQPPRGLRDQLARLLLLALAQPGLRRVRHGGNLPSNPKIGVTLCAAAARRAHAQHPGRLGAGGAHGVRDARRHLRPRPGRRAQLAVAGRERQLALEHVERLDVVAMDVRRRRRRRAPLASAIAISSTSACSSAPSARRAAPPTRASVAGRPPSGGGRLLVVDERAAVAQRAHVVGEAHARARGS